MRKPRCALSAHRGVPGSYGLGGGITILFLSQPAFTLVLICMTVPYVED